MLLFSMSSSSRSHHLHSVLDRTHCIVFAKVVKTVRCQRDWWR